MDRVLAALPGHPTTLGTHGSWQGQAPPTHPAAHLEQAQQRVQALGLVGAPLGRVDPAPPARERMSGPARGGWHGRGRLGCGPSSAQAHTISARPTRPPVKERVGQPQHVPRPLGLRMRPRIPGLQLPAGTWRARHQSVGMAWSPNPVMPPHSHARPAQCTHPPQQLVQQLRVLFVGLVIVPDVAKVVAWNAAGAGGGCCCRRARAWRRRRLAPAVLPAVLAAAGVAAVAAATYAAVLLIL